MSKYKYQNLNPFPIWLPGERGEQVMFRPNESTTKNWFSRFVGPKRLARVPNDPRAVRRTSVPAVTEIPEPVLTTQPPKAPSFANKETDEYTVRDGLYTCKLCGTFVTGSSSSMQAHIASFHKKPVRVDKPVQTDPEERVVVSSRESASAQAKPEDSEEITRTASGKPPVEPTPESPAKTPEKPPDAPKPTKATGKKGEEWFACPHPGCGKAFTSNRGLQMHITRVHGRD